ncbi:MAG: class I SAM-dependent methyltransferase [Bacteroidota bacterium]
MLNQSPQRQIETTIANLYRDSQNDYLKMIGGMAKGLFRPLQPADFKDAYLSISQEQGEFLTELIKAHQLRNIVEFGTSFGISTLFLALGAMETGGHIITTELVETKAQQALQNFEQAGVENWIELRVGDAMQTLQDHHEPIDLLLLDGWKDLYQPLFQLLEPQFHAKTWIYVDNADMRGVQAFLKPIARNPRYKLTFRYHGKVGLITLNA